MRSPSKRKVVGSTPAEAFQYFIGKERKAHVLAYLLGYFQVDQHGHGYGKGLELLFVIGSHQLHQIRVASVGILEIVQLSIHIRHISHRGSVLPHLLGSYHPHTLHRSCEYQLPFWYLGVEGDFWKNCAADAANHFMNLTNRPQAIVCANDYMALSLCKELTLQGYSVPQDVAISGFDDVRDARANVPPLTTCSVSIPDMAKKAMETINTLLNGKEAPACTFVPTKIIIRNSCGCESSTMKDLSLSRMYEVELMEQLINHNAHNTFVSISLENMTSAEDIGDYLRLEDVPDIARSELMR